MNFLKLKTLFICFYFPPFNRVGGRRWAKHLKYLSRLDDSFLVLAGDYDTVSNWDKDIKQFENRVTRVGIKIKYPYFKRKLPSNFIEKIIWLASKYIWSFRSKLYRGNFWDDSVGYEKEFYNQACRIIDENKIEQIVITLGPFKVSSIIPKLKRKYPYLKIIVDYRDRLEESEHAMSKRSFYFEKQLQNKLLNITDLVFSPYDYMKLYYEKEYGKKSLLMPHCYDEEDFKSLNFFSEKETDEFRLVYGGALYTDLEKHLNRLFEIARNIISCGLKVRIDLYTPQKGYEKLVENSGLNIKIKQIIPVVDFYNEVLKSDMSIVFRPDWSNDNFSSKFFELIRLGKPILYFGSKSIVSDFIVKNNLGYFAEEISVDSKINEMLNNVKYKKNKNNDFPIVNFSFDNVTKQFVECLNEIN